MEPLDAVILAGGRSERLRGIVPPHHKPLLVVNGRSLIGSVIHHAYEVHAERIIVVTCPEIAQPVAQLVESFNPHVRGRVIITTDARGVGPALWHGTRLAGHPRLLVLLADNFVLLDDVKLVCREEYAVGVRQVPTLDAYRFTRWVRGRWVEDKITAADTDLTQVWCGPLVLDRQRVLRFVDPHVGGKIGPSLDRFVPRDKRLVRVPVECVDIGTPEELAKMTGGPR